MDPNITQDELVAANVKLQAAVGFHMMTALVLEVRLEATQATIAQLHASLQASEEDRARVRATLAVSQEEERRLKKIVNAFPPRVRKAIDGNQD